MADKCTICGDDLLPDEASVCWQCEMELPASKSLVISAPVALPMTTADRLLAAVVILMGYLMMMGAR